MEQIWLYQVLLNFILLIDDNSHNNDMDYNRTRQLGTTSTLNATATNNYFNNFHQPVGPMIGMQINNNNTANNNLFSNLNHYSQNVLLNHHDIKFKKLAFYEVLHEIIKPILLHRKYILIINKIIKNNIYILIDLFSSN